MEGNSKVRIIHLLEILKKTDPQHPINTIRILSKLKLLGIQAERKSIMRDIATLRDIGHNIITCDELNRGYYMTGQLFEESELKIVADAICDSSFLTLEDTEKLLSKLKSVATPSGEEILRDMTFIDPEIKAQLSAARATIDKIICAIKQRKMISFQYYTYTSTGQNHLDRDGNAYEVSPYFLLFVHGKYYLLANVSGNDRLTFFDSAFIGNLNVIDIASRPKSEIIELGNNFKLYDFLRKSSSLYIGDLSEVVLECASSIRTDVLRKFGYSIMLSSTGSGTFFAHVKVVQNIALYRWILSYCDSIRVISPPELREKMSSLAHRLYDEYCGEDKT